MRDKKNNQKELIKEIQLNIEEDKIPLSGICLKLTRLLNSLGENERVKALQGLYPILIDLEDNLNLSKAELNSIHKNLGILLSGQDNLDKTAIVLRKASLLQDIEKNQIQYRLFKDNLCKIIQEVSLQLEYESQGMWILLGNITIEKKIIWHLDKLSKREEKDGLIIKVNTGFSSVDYMPKEVLKKLADIFNNLNINWGIPKTKKWIFDAAKMQDNFPELKTKDWFRGFFNIKPEVQISQISAGKSYFTVSFYIAADESEDAREHNALELFDTMNFNDKVIKASRDLFKDGHYRQAVHDSAIALESYVKEKSGLDKIIGQDLMFKALSEDNPLIKVNDLGDLTKIDEQAGIKYIAGGTMRSIKNVFGHSEKKIDDYLKALKLLAIISYIFDSLP